MRIKRIGRILFTAEDLAERLGIEGGKVKVAHASTEFTDMIELVVEGPTMPLSRAGFPMEAIHAVDLKERQVKS